MHGQDRGRAVGVVRPAAWVLVGSLGVLLVSGLPLLWWYRPDSRVPLQELHTSAAVVFAVASLVLLVATVIARLRHRSVPVGWLAAVGLFVLAQMAGATGEWAAWDALVVSEPVDRDRGVVAALQPEVTVILSGDHELSPSGYLSIVTAHLVVLPAAVLVVLARSRRQARAAATDDSSTGDPGAA